MRREPKGLADRMANIVGLAAVRLVDDGDGGQRLQLELLADEVLEDVDRHQDYGFASHPQPGATAVTIALGGTRGRSMAIAVGDRRYRLALSAGEVAIHDDQGQKVHLTRDGIVVASAGALTFDIGGAVVFNCASFQVAAEGAATIDGSEVNLGGTGGQGVGRKTDAVSGGVITGGSTKVKST